MSDEEHMRRAIAQARLGEGFTSPNPTVGCVIVRDEQIVGQGFTAPPGGPHAEVRALAEAGDAARGATAYTTLEPCNHTGRTGPCSEALIEAGIARVVFAVADPHPQASGGAARLEEAGVATTAGILGEEARETLHPWLLSLSGHPLPHVTAKIASSLDGRTATRTGESKWITGTEARLRGHDLRQRSDAVLVGVGTVLADDPSLDARPEGKLPAPILKVVLDTHLRTPPTAKLLRSPGQVLIACAEDADRERRAALKAAGAELLSVQAGPDGLDLHALFRALRDRQCLSVMVEGGARLLGSAFDARLVDEVWAFIAPVVIGGGQPAIAGQGPEALADALRLSGTVTERLGQDILVRGQSKREGEPCSPAS